MELKTTILATRSMGQSEAEVSILEGEAYLGWFVLNTFILIFLRGPAEGHTEAHFTTWLFRTAPKESPAGSFVILIVPGTQRKKFER